MPAEGTRAQVMHGTAEHTSGGLTKSDLKYNKNGKIVSRKRSTLAKRQNRLLKAGWGYEKGKFGAVKVEKKTKKNKNKSTKRRR